MKYLKFGVLIIASLLAFADSASAHGLAITHPINSGEYLIEFEYEAPGQPTAGYAYPYTIRLLKADSKEPVAFATVQVQITNKDGSILSTNLRSTPGLTGVAAFITTLPAGGDYSADVRIRDDADATIASGSANFSAAGGEGATASRPIAGLRGWGIIAIAVVVGVLIGMVLPRGQIKI